MKNEKRFIYKLKQPDGRKRSVSRLAVSRVVKHLKSSDAAQPFAVHSEAENFLLIKLVADLLKDELNKRCIHRILALMNRSSNKDVTDILIKTSPLSDSLDLHLPTGEMSILLLLPQNASVSGLNPLVLEPKSPLESAKP
jgi:hypothetical protein